MKATNRILQIACRSYRLPRGRYRLIDLARRHIGGVVLGKDRFGNRLLLDLDNYVDAMVFLAGSYEDESMTLFAQVAHERGCETVVDIGANIGCYTTFFARQHWISRVYCFEPDPNHYAQLQANVWLNDGVRKISTYNLALSDASGTAELYVPRKVRRRGTRQYNTSASAIESPSAAAEPTTVPVRRLDDVLGAGGCAAAIKIDVEGHELHVLRGMPHWLRSNARVLLIESGQARFAAADELLRDAGLARVDVHLPFDNHLYRRVST